jgi:hypothetical protein
VEYKALQLYLLATKRHSICEKQSTRAQKVLKPRQNIILKAPQNTATSMPTLDRRTMLHTLNSY